MTTTSDLHVVLGASGGAGNAIARALHDAGLRTPFAQLCTGRRIPNHRYWQAATLVGMLLSQDRYRSRLAQLVAAFEKTGSSDLTPHLEPVFGTDWDGVRSDWIRFCRGKYRP